MADARGEPDVAADDPAVGEGARREAAADGTGPEAAADGTGPGPAAAPAIPPRLVLVAYALAFVCAVAPLAVLGAGFAGAVLFTRGRRGAGAGVIVVAVLCAALGVVLLR